MTLTEVDQVATSLTDGVLRVVINRPNRMNAVTTDTLKLMTATFTKAADNPAVRVAVLAGAGRAFCTGADLAGRHAGDPPSSATIDAANDLAAAIRAFPSPVISAVHGPAAGVGVSLALACDLTVAAESSYFLLAFTKVGLMPDGGATALVAASVGRARAMKMALMADRLGAPAALEAGLISYVYADDEFDGALEELSRRLATGPSHAFRQTKQAINDATLTELESAFQRERSGQMDLLGTADFAEGVAAFQEKRTAAFL